MWLLKWQSTQNWLNFESYCVRMHFLFLFVRPGQLLSVKEAKACLPTVDRWTLLVSCHLHSWEWDFNACGSGSLLCLRLDLTWKYQTPKHHENCWHKLGLKPSAISSPAEVVSLRLNLCIILIEFIVVVRWETCTDRLFWSAHHFLEFPKTTEPLPELSKSSALSCAILWLL